MKMEIEHNKKVVDEFYADLDVIQKNYSDRLKDLGERIRAMLQEHCDEYEVNYIVSRVCRGFVSAKDHTVIYHPAGEPFHHMLSRAVTYGNTLADYVGTVMAATNKPTSFHKEILRKYKVMPEMVVNTNYLYHELILSVPDFRFSIKARSYEETLEKARKVLADHFEKAKRAAPTQEVKEKKKKFIPKK